MKQNIAKIEKELQEELERRKKSESYNIRLNDLRETLMSPAGISEKLKTITDGIVSIFDADFARVWVIKPADLCENGCIHAQVTEGPHVCRHRDFCLHLMTSSGRYTHIDGGHRRVPFGCYKIGRIAANEDKKFLTNDAANDPRVHNHEWVKELGLVSFAGYRLLNSSGKVLGVLALFSKHPVSSEEDALLAGLVHTTEQVIMATSAEQEVRMLNETLEKRVEERTIQLESTNRVLSQEIAERKKAEASLEEANNELRNFVYIASHDLREPLRKITSFGTILEQSLQGKLTDDDSENLRFMTEGAARMTQMIEGLLAYSRVSTKSQSAQAVDLNEIIKQLRQLELAVLLEEKQAVIEVPQPLPCVEADPVQIRQLMQNFIANGLKYQKKGDTPHIAITSKPDADGMVRIEVTDNGIGIAPEYQGVLFVMFKRLHSRSEYEGTGIGLAVCKKIAERHGGKVGVESEPGKGSTFWFTIPAAEKSALKEKENKNLVGVP